MVSKPMTTKRAVQLYECKNCKVGNFCEHDCIASNTCSVTCNRCKEIIWFSGNQIPKLFKCPYCTSTVNYEEGNRYATRTNFKNNNGSGISR